jgi:hypothetical protein
MASLETVAKGGLVTESDDLAARADVIDDSMGDGGRVFFLLFILSGDGMPETACAGTEGVLSGPDCL